MLTLCRGCFLVGVGTAEGKERMCMHLLCSHDTGDAYDYDDDDDATMRV